jgi:glyoxylase-like metal-dependent hydrolase (beta-lactamase superfamily II)
MSVFGGDPNVRIRQPVPGLLLEVDGGWLLLDAGINEVLFRDAQLRRRFANPDIETELVDGEDNVEAAFAAVGIDPEDVVAVGVSHFHFDHVGGLKHFAGRVPVHAQRAEVEHGLRAAHPAPEREGIFRIDFDDPAIDWRLADGDTALVPGVTALLTRGHTPGHQSFLVELATGGGYVFAFDAADLRENIDDERAIGETPYARPDETVETIRRLKAIAAERGYPVIPGHDLSAWEAFTAQAARALVT